MSESRSMTHSVQSSTVADILERVLDKGIVIAGDIKIKLVDIELLTIQIRLVICSVEKAKELGMDWWALDKMAGKKEFDHQQEEIKMLRDRVEKLETVA